MNKHFKFILAGAAVIAGLAGAVSCQDLSKDLDDLTSKVNSLESKLTSLESAIKAGDVITSVTQVAGGIQVTTNNGTYTITNGKDGANGTNGTNGTDGKDGANGTVWTIGDDGFWYKDGVKTDYKAIGKDGENGSSTVWTIGEDGYWYKDGVKTDNRAVAVAADGSITAVYDSANGTLTFYGKDADGNDFTTVINTTAELKSLAIIPEVMHDGNAVMDFYGIVGYPANADLLKKSIADPSNVNYRPIGSSFPIVRYRVNPTNANLKGYALDMLNRTVEVRAASDDSNDLLAILGAENNKGELSVQLALADFVYEDGPVPAMYLSQILRQYGWDETQTNNMTTFYPWTLDYLSWDSYYNQHSDSAPWHYIEGWGGNNTVDFVALQAVDAETKAEIVSDYAQVDFGFLDRFFIVHSNYYKQRGNYVVYYPYVPDTNVDFGYYNNLPHYLADHGTNNNRNIPTGVMTEVVGNVKNALSAEAKAVVPAYYDSSSPFAGKVRGDAIADLAFRFDTEMNIKDSLRTYSPVATRIMEELGLEVTYKFAFPDTYLGEDGITNQQKFVDKNLAAQGILKLNPEFLPENGRAAVGRTPVVKVQAYAYNGQVLLAETWIKVRITNDEANERLEPFEYVVEGGEFEYEDFIPYTATLGDYPKGSKLTITWEEMNQKVLNKVKAALHNTPGISFEEFKNLYQGWIALEYPQWGKNGYEYFIEVNDSRFGQKIPNGIDYDRTFEYNFGTDTDLVGIYFNDQFDIEDGKSVSNKVTLRIPSRDTYTAPDILLTFNYTVKHDHTWPKVNNDYYLGQDAKGRDIVQVKGRLVGGAVEFSSENREHFENYMKDKANNIVDPAKNHDKDAFLYFKLAANQTGATISGTNFKNQKIYMTTALIGDHKDYVVDMYDQMNNNVFMVYNATTGNYDIKPNADNTGDYVSVCHKQYIVRFKNIFHLNMKPATLVDKISPDSIDLAGKTGTGAKDPYYLTITDDDKDVIWENGAVTTKGTDKYGTMVVNVTYDIDVDNTFFDAVTNKWMLTISGSVVTWENLGTRLVNPKTGAWYPIVKIGNGTQNWVEFNTEMKSGKRVITDKADVKVNPQN